MKNHLPIILECHLFDRASLSFFDLKMLPGGVLDYSFADYDYKYETKELFEPKMELWKEFYLLLESIYLKQRTGVDLNIGELDSEVKWFFHVKYENFSFIESSGIDAYTDSINDLLQAIQLLIGNRYIVA